MAWSACPPMLVGWARVMAPASFMVYDRAGDPAMELGGRNSYYGNGSDLMHLFDLETGERRLGKLEDVSVAARLCDALPNIDFVMSGAWPDGMERRRDVPAAVQHHDQEHHQAAGDDGRRRGDRGADVAHGLRGARRRRGAARASPTS